MTEPMAALGQTTSPAGAKLKALLWDTSQMPCTPVAFLGSHLGRFSDHLCVHVPPLWDTRSALLDSHDCKVSDKSFATGTQQRGEEGTDVPKDRNNSAGISV